MKNLIDKILFNYFNLTEEVKSIDLTQISVDEFVEFMIRIKNLS